MMMGCVASNAAPDSSGGLDSCIKYLKGNSDEQRLVGLLLATKFVKGDDRNSILQVFNAVGIQFISRLLKSGVQIKDGSANKQEDPYVQLATSVLSAFCRVQELASSDEIIDKIPAVLDILRRKLVAPIRNDCLECLLGIGLSSSKGLCHLQQSKALPLLLEVLLSTTEDLVSSHLIFRIVQLILTGDIAKKQIHDYAAEIVASLPVLAELFSAEQGSFKFEMLHCLRTLSSGITSVQHYVEGSGKVKCDWLKNIRVGVAEVLQKQVAIEQKYMALELIESMIEIFGRTWLLGPMVLPGEKNTAPSDRFFLLLVETLRVETLVILNEIARVHFDNEYIKHEKSEIISNKQQILATCYALLESVISISIEEEDEKEFTDFVVKQTVSALSEIIKTLFEFLNEAKEHNLRKGDDLLASVRLLSRYLADTMSFQKNFKNQFLSVIDFLCTITSVSEESPFLSIQFLLPALCQVTTEKEGCQALLSWGGHKQVIAFMLEIIHRGDSLGLVIKAGDIILNLLQKETRLNEYFSVIDFLPLLAALPSYADILDESIGISMSGCICALILDLTDEQQLLTLISMDILLTACSGIVKTLCFLQDCEMLPDAEEHDLWELCLYACVDLIERYPSLKGAVKSSALTPVPRSNSTNQLLLRSLLVGD